MLSQRQQADAERLLGNSLARTKSGLTDRELVDCFVEQRDEAAFATLIERHGGMVLGVCRRLLRNRHDAEDACQATFLILASKAHTIQKKEALASWLHGVAYRVSGNLRRRLTRERSAFSPLDDVPGGDLEQDISWREVRHALDEELARLDELHRAPLVLCYLEGLTRDEAAQRLGWGLGKLRGRLDRGKRLLQNRLRRRGITLSVALLGLTTTSTEALASTLASAPCQVAAGQGTVADLVSPRVAELVTSGAELTLASAKKVGFVMAAVFGMFLIGGVCALASKFVGSVEASKPVDVELPREPPLPAHAVARLGTLDWSHGTDVLALGIAPDCKSMATSTAAGLVVLWDTQTGKRIRQWRAGSNHAYRLAYSPDGKLLAVLVAGKEHRITLWQSSTGAKLAECVGHSRAPLALAWSKDGKRLTSAGLDQTIRQWDTTTGKETTPAVAIEGSMRNIWLSPRGKYTVTLEEHKGEKKGSLFSAVLRETKTGRELTRDDVTHNVSIGFSEDERFQIIGSHGRFSLRDTATGKTLWSIETPPFACTAVNFSSEAKMVIAGFEDGKVRCFDPTNGAKIQEFAAHSARVRGVAYLPGRGAIVSVGDDNRIHLTKATGGTPLSARVGHLGEIFGVMYSQDGKRIVTASEDDSLIFWDAQTYRELGRSTCSSRKVRALRFSNDGRVLVGADSDSMVRVWELDVERHRSKSSATKIVKFWISDLALSKDGNIVFKGASDAKVYFWTRSTKKVQVFEPKFLQHGPIPDDAEEIVIFSIAMLPNRVLSIDCDPEGSTFSATSYREVILWDTQRGALRWRHPIAKVGHHTDVLYSPDGRRVALMTRSTGTIQIREVSTGLLLATFSPPSKSRSEVVRYSPDGRLLALGTQVGRVHVLDAETGKNLCTLNGHLGSVVGLAFAPDGSRMVSASGDTTAMIWDLAKFRRARKEVRPLTAEESERVWQVLGTTRDGPKVKKALARLAAAPSASLTLTKRHLSRDQSARLRAEITQWIDELDDDDFQTRESATSALEQVGRQAEVALREALAKSKSAEARARIAKLLKRLAGEPGGMLPMEQVRWLRILEVLERLETKEARALVAELASNKANPWLASEARLVSERLGKP